MKVLVTGAKGQLGHDVLERLTALGIENTGADIEDFDLTNERQTREYIRKLSPDGIVHCAAYTAVDKAESNRETCMEVNGNGTRNVAAAARDVGAKLLYISTDYVFGGEGDAPYETDAPKKPLSVYGESKYLGETAVRETLRAYFIVRTSWVFGKNGGNFVKTMLRLGAEKPSISVVSDQIGSPTYTVDLARLICDMIQTEKYGEYHATNEGFCSWYEFAREIMREAGLSCVPAPVASRDYPSVAARPANSRLSKRSLAEAGFALLPTWQNALSRFLKTL